jgi:hypothetical protein
MPLVSCRLTLLKLNKTAVAAPKGAAINCPQKRQPVSTLSTTITIKAAMQSATTHELPESALLT